MTSQTLLEYLEPIKRGPRRVICLATLKWLQADGRAAVTATEIKRELMAARFPKAAQFNVADVLAKAGHYVTSSKDGANANLWSLTGTGETWVKKQLGVVEDPPIVVNSISGLDALAQKMTDDVIKGYVDEALLCYKTGALRASVVFLWSGAIRHLQDRALGTGVRALSDAIRKHDPKAREVKKIEDFSAVKDVTQLLSFRELGLIDKGEWQTLQEGLDLRNRCGHPTKYHPGVNRVSAFMEDVIGIAF